MEDLPEELKLQYKGCPRKPSAICSRCGVLISNAHGSASASCGDSASVETAAITILAELRQG